MSGERRGVTLRMAEAGMIRRIELFAVGAWFILSIVELMRAGLAGFIALTCSALVVIIAFFWMERFVQRVLRPIPDASAWSSAVGVLSRYVLLSAALAVIIIVVRFNTLSVLLGSSVIVAGIAAEALYSLTTELLRARSARSGESHGT